MRFLTMHRPLAAAAAGALVRTTAIRTAPIGARLANALPVQGVRYASVKSQGAYKKKSKRGIPKKMGAKRTGGMSISFQPLERERETMCLVSFGLEVPPPANLT
jgi:hypothetical protein